MEPVSCKIDTSRGPADKAIEPILELSSGAQIKRREVAKDSLAFHARTETIAHTTRWQKKFAAFLERLSAVAVERARGIESTSKTLQSVDQTDSPSLFRVQ
jgi:hypothetical protein